MARPRLSAEQRKSCSLTIWVTPAERELLRERASAAGVPLTAFVRAAALGRRTRGRPRRELAAEDRRELLRVGNNINQIARRVNRRGWRAAGRAPVSYRRPIEEAARALERVVDLLGGEGAGR